MTGPEHYRQAERLLAEAAVEGAEGIYFVRPENLAAAQAHATLALAAATALSGEDESAWREAVGVPRSPSYVYTSGAAS